MEAAFPLNQNQGDVRVSLLVQLHERTGHTPSLNLDQLPLKSGTLTE